MAEPLESLREQVLVDSSDEEGLDDKGAVDASAKAVYRRLNPDGKAELKLDEVLGRIGNAEGQESKEKQENKKHVEKVVRKLLRVKGEKGFCEKDMKRLNQRFMKGHLPRLKKRQKYSKDDEESEDDGDDRKRNEGMRRKIFRHAIRSVQTAWRYAEKCVSRTGRAWLWTLLPTGQISTMLSFLLFSYVINASFLAWFVPLATLTVSIVFMLVSSIRLVRGKKRFAEFKAWADFLDEISATEEKSIDTGLAEENYILKHVSPYIHFSTATAFCVMGFGTSNKTWVPSAELGILSFLMYGMIFYVYNFHRNTRSLSLFGLQFSAVVARGFRCGSGSEVFGFIAQFPIPFTENHINLSLASLLRVALLLRVVSLSMGKPPSQKLSVHIVKVILPHGVALAWFDMADMFFCFSCFASITRASLEYLTLLFAMPAFTLFLSYTLLKSLLSFEFAKLAVTIAVVGVTVAYFSLWKKKKEALQQAAKVINFASMKKMFGITGFILLGYVMFSYRPSGLEVPKSNLLWSDYRDLCLKNKEHSLSGNNIATSAICHEFKGYGITWDGAVEKIDVVEIENKVEDLLNLLPRSAAEWLSCMHGEPYPDPDKCKENLEKLSPVGRQLCLISPIVKRPCHIQKHNIYTFKVTVQMPGDDPTSLVLNVPNDFNAMVLDLQEGSPLRFTGTITALKTDIAVKALTTSTDGDEIRRLERRHKRIEKTMGNILDQAFDALCDFVFYPIVSFGEDDEAE